ncbi:MAG TPA: cytochrome c biogenesis protein CcdA [Prolixibacteraceae bacterium]|nr:cytochrome c biogenesis protein CcdA [Prolixibacteraceae bacterium]
MKYSAILFFLLTTLWGVSLAQPKNPVAWSFDHEKMDDGEFELHFTASIEKGWHLYSQKLPEGGPIATTFHFTGLPDGVEKIGEISASAQPVKVFDKAFNMELEYFSNSVTFTQIVRLSNDQTTSISGYIEYMSCDDESCTPPAETEFTFIVGNDKAQTASPESAAPIKTQLEEPVKNEQKKENGGLLFLLLAFVAGLAAVVTPCVFPMIPMTVSFFMRGSENRGKAIFTALFFGGSIVFIFALLGALFTFNVFGADVANVLSTHWLPNALFFILFVVFALSFFGLFELVLPGSLVNKTDAQADKGGLIGAFFMALTTVIVSFSCTGPFIGSLIISAVQEGGWMPLFGMTAFGLAFATPFTLLAFFPSALKKLPKSGGWLNEIKVVFAFVLTAFSLKFLNVVFLDFMGRDLFLAIWITLAILLGIYLLGKIRFSHDSEVSRIGVGRLFLVIASFTFAIYLFTGLLGAPLKAVSSLLPAQEIRMVASTSAPIAEHPTTLCGPAKYADKLHLPHGLTGYFELEQGLACAKEQNKPVFLVFKGHACANCKKMENTVWAEPEVLEKLRNDYIVIALYTDDRTPLPESEWKVSATNGKTLKTMGKVNLDLLISKYNINSIPYHVVIEPGGDEHVLEVTYNAEVFSRFLDEGLN